MVIVSGKAKAPPGAFERLRSMMETVITETRKEDGCIDYSYGIDILDPDTIIILEYWENWDALHAHFTKPHMQPWIKALSELEMVWQDVKAAETGETRQLLS